ncbi:MAG: MOSC domain-containing protein [Pseudomonadota bacterium]
MNKPEQNIERQREIVRARKLSATVAHVLMAQGKNFVSEPVAELPLSYDGIRGDFHAGLVRSSGGREPWYPRGTEMRNERQVSILSVEELALIADDMGLKEVKPGWIGTNLVLEGIPDMSFLPPRTLLMFDGGVTLRVDGYNAPCRIAGGEIARHVGASKSGGPLGELTTGGEVDWTSTDMALAFKDAAHMRRGLVAWVEREGVIKPGEKLMVRIWEQWIY